MIELKAFLMASGSLTAILLVWMQLWATFLGRRRTPWTSGVGLMWSFTAVLLALMSFAWTGYVSLNRSAEMQKAPSAAIALFVAAFIMAALNVVQSLYFISIKVWSGRILRTPLPWMESLPLLKRRCVILYSAVLAAAVISLSIWVALGGFPASGNKWAVVGVVGVCVIVLGYCLWRYLKK